VGEQLAGALLKAASGDRWTRLLAARLLDETETASDAGDHAMLDLILFLKSLPLFHALTLEEVAFLAERADTTTPAAGSILFEAGEPVRYFSVIRAGTAELSIDGVAVDRVGAGSAFGETAFLEDARHALGGVALTDMVVLRFHRALIADLVAEHPMVLPQVLADWQRRLARLYGRLAEQTTGRKARTGPLPFPLTIGDGSGIKGPSVNSPGISRLGSADECA
jgi:CRP-like cAMP-binding protein